MNGRYWAIMKESKTVIIIVYVLYATPIPFSLISWAATIMAIAAIGMEDWTKASAWIQGIFAFSAMLVVSLYLVSYIVSLSGTIGKKRLSKISLLPLIHIIAAIILVSVWFWLESIF